ARWGIVEDFHRVRAEVVKNLPGSLFADPINEATGKVALDAVAGGCDQVHGIGAELLAVVFVDGPGAGEAHRFARLQLDHFADDDYFIVNIFGQCMFLIRMEAQNRVTGFGIVKDNVLDNPFNTLFRHTLSWNSTFSLYQGLEQVVSVEHYTTWI